MADRGAGGPAWFGDQPDGGNVNNPGGLIGVWAEANTRDTIFDALRRREAFGDSGPRIHVRFFAGWDYPADLDTRRDMLEEPYRTGVPMGSDLPVDDAPGAGARRGDAPVRPADREGTGLELSDLVHAGGAVALAFEAFPARLLS